MLKADQDPLPGLSLQHDNNKGEDAAVRSA